MKTRYWFFPLLGFGIFLMWINSIFGGGGEIVNGKQSQLPYVLWIIILISFGICSYCILGKIFKTWGMFDKILGLILTPIVFSWSLLQGMASGSCDNAQTVGCFVGSLLASLLIASLPFGIIIFLNRRKQKQKTKPSS